MEKKSLCWFICKNIHINILKTASKYGEVIVGLLTMRL